MSKSFQAGSLMHGTVQGIRSATRKFPLSTAFICKYMRQLFPDMQFGSVGLFRDVFALPHRDLNHESNTDSAIAAFSFFSNKEVCGLRTTTGTVSLIQG